MTLAIELLKASIEHQDVALLKNAYLSAHLDPRVRKLCKLMEQLAQNSTHKIWEKFGAEIQDVVDAGAAMDATVSDVNVGRRFWGIERSATGFGAGGLNFCVWGVW